MLTVGPTCITSVGCMHTWFGWTPSWPRYQATHTHRLKTCTKICAMEVYSPCLFRHKVRWNCANFLITSGGVCLSYATFTRSLLSAIKLKHSSWVLALIHKLSSVLTCILWPCPPVDECWQVHHPPCSLDQKIENVEKVFAYLLSKGTKLRYTSATGQYYKVIKTLSCPLVIQRRYLIVGNIFADRTLKR